MSQSLAGDEKGGVGALQNQVPVARASPRCFTSIGRTCCPDFSGWVGSSATTIPHGTTVLAFKYANGVVVAGDRLATEGHRVASRDVEKVFSTDAYSLMAISGAAGPCIEMGRVLSVELEHYEKIEGESLELEGKANKLSQMIRANLPAAMQGLVVIPLFAGYDLRRKSGRLWKFDVTGGRYEEAEYEATGSGGLFARESLKKTWNAGLSTRRSSCCCGHGPHRCGGSGSRHGWRRSATRHLPDHQYGDRRGHRADARRSEIEEIYRDILERAPGAASAGGIERCRMPFYVSPEQVMADKAEFARKGIARGKSIVALEFAGGVLLIAVNSTSLSKIGEIYDRVAFAGVGKFSEFDHLRKIGGALRGHQGLRLQPRRRARQGPRERLLPGGGGGLHPGDEAPRGRGDRRRGGATTPWRATRRTPSTG